MLRAPCVPTAGVGVLLVGDQLANVVLGYDDAQVTIDDMEHHVAVAPRARSSSATCRG
jgi:ketopantoate hydroxymethyltransferase